MAWIESHQALARHPKTMRLADTLKCNVPCAIGYLHLFWWWALDYAPNGLVPAEDKPVVARACMWSKKSEEFWAALMTAGFVEQAELPDVLRIHDWMDYGGKLTTQRTFRKESNRRAQAKRRQRYVSDDVPLSQHNVSAESALNQQPTQHNSTQHNRTDPPLPPQTVSADTRRCYRCQRLESEPPTEDCKNASWHTVVVKRPGPVAPTPRGSPDRERSDLTAAHPPGGLDQHDAPAP